jgi:transposase
VGQIVNEHGIPLTQQTMDGATSDNEWNKIALDYFDRVRLQGFSQGIYVADCKLMTQELVERMNEAESKISFVSRCPANFNDCLEARMIEKAYQVDAEEWEEMGQVTQGKSGSSYRAVSFIEDVFGCPMRLLVLESTSLVESAKRTLEKTKPGAVKRVKEIEKKKFVCVEDAEEELRRFNQYKELKMFGYQPEIVKSIQEKWPPGRRSPQTRPKITVHYAIRIHQLAFNEERYQQQLRNDSAFVLISNLTDETAINNETLLKTYKGQQVVENSFRQLKEPKLASVIYLKNPKRIKAMTMLLCISLLIRAIIQFRMRDGLEKFNAENPGEVIYAGWGGKPLKNPTFHLLYEHSINCIYERVSSNEYTFAWSTQKTCDLVEPLLMLMGVSVSTILN